jgi:hypothetical protein
VFTTKEAALAGWLGIETKNIRINRQIAFIKDSLIVFIASPPEIPKAHCCSSYYPCVTRLDWATLAASVHEFIISEFHINKIMFFKFLNWGRIL